MASSTQSVITRKRYKPSTTHLRTIRVLWVHGEQNGLFGPRRLCNPLICMLCAVSMARLRALLTFLHVTTVPVFFFMFLSTQPSPKTKNPFIQKIKSTIASLNFQLRVIIQPAASKCRITNKNKNQTFNHKRNCCETPSFLLLIVTIILDLFDKYDIVQKK